MDHVDAEEEEVVVVVEEEEEDDDADRGTLEDEVGWEKGFRDDDTGKVGAGLNDDIPIDTGDVALDVGLIPIGDTYVGGVTDTLDCDADTLLDGVGGGVDGLVDGNEGRVMIGDNTVTIP